MVDVRLLYPRDKYEAAVRLAEALTAAGYSVEREALAEGGAFPRLAAQAGGAKVLLLIWSRGLVTAAMAPGALAEARRQPSLVEVSVDSIEPAFGGEASPVILLSGWRGQPFHPGWRRILAEVERRSGPGELPARAVPAPQGRPVRAAEVAAGASPRRRPAARAFVAAGALIAATLAAATALEWRSPAATDNRPVAVAARPAPAADEAIRAPAASPAPVTPVTEASPEEALPAPSAPVVASAEARTPESGETRPRKPAATQRHSARRLAAAPEPGVKRYSRKHSKTMRLFCQRSGRSTPQCRTFARSMREDRG
ncbi:MAG TPA: hypothetical protein VD846_07250 [Allosphingosinicella sp.]|nr:hypothetical protein [Allosphingosinicella sp.]